MFFFFNDTATTEIYTLSLHDALPISSSPYFIFCGAVSNCLWKKYNFFNNTYICSRLVLSGGIEPPFQASEACVLSIERRKGLGSCLVRLDGIEPSTATL